MKQQVNLYQAVLYPPRHEWGLKLLLICWSSLLVLLAAIWLWQQHQAQQQQATLASVQQQLALQQQEFTLYQEALTKRQPSAALAKQLSVEQRALQQKQQLLSFLSVQQQTASQHYSPVLAHLTKVDRQELWLTHFSLQQQHSSFAGITLQPDSVPFWLEDLRQLGYFHGQRFGQVSMQQVPERKAVSFALQAEQGGAL